MILYDYFRSSACYRVRIALNLKGLSYDKHPIHLINNGGEQHSESYQQINPQQLVPSLEVNSHILHQSLAIMEYLDETHQEPPLLPKEPLLRARARALALTVACDIHPVNNLRVLNYLKGEFQADEEQIRQWYHHWLKAGFDAIESELQQHHPTGPFCLGDAVSIADICLIPQVFNAHRFKFSMYDYPLINEINEHCMLLPAFKETMPIE